MPTDRKYLEQRDGVWWTQVAVPVKARPYIEGGKKLLRACLKTRDLRRANEEKGEHVTQFKREIRAAMMRAGRPDAVETLEQGALMWRKPKQSSTEMELSEIVLTSVVEEMSEEDGMGYDDNGDFVLSERAANYYAIASGDATPISLLLDDFIKSYRGRKSRTVEARRHAIKSLTKWLRQEKVPANVEEVTRRVASSYKEHMIGRGDARDTINKALGGLRLYWRWMMDAGHFKDAPNPWDRQSVAKIEMGNDDEPEINAYTDAEIVTLFDHADAAGFRDAMAIAALSGLRRGELFALTVADCTDGFFHVQKGKTKSARRMVPVHSTLKPIVAQLCEGKGPGDLLLADRTQVRKQSPSRIIGDAFGKRFGRLRQEALPQSNGTNFHSFRHYFGTKLRLARIDEPTVALLMGHANKNITFGRYAKLRGQNLTAEQLKELREFLTPSLEAVKLPDAVKA